MQDVVLANLKCQIHGLDIERNCYIVKAKLLGILSIYLMTYCHLYSPVLSSQLVLGVRLGLTTDVAAGFPREEEKLKFTDLNGLSGPGSFSPHEGQNLNSGCNFVPHWGQKWKGILQE